MRSALYISNEHKKNSSDIYQESFDAIYSLNKTKINFLKDLFFTTVDNKIKVFSLESAKAKQKERHKVVEDKLDNADMVIFRRLQKDDYISSIPKVLNKIDNDLYSFSHAFPSKIQNIVVLSKNKSGDLIEFSKVKYYKDRSDRILARRLVLLHETSHCEFDNIKHRFQPKNLKLKDATVESLNKVVFSKSCNSPSNLIMKLNEAFADFYGSVMFLESCNYSSESFREVELLLSFREKNGQDKTEYSKNNYLYCHSAIKYLLENIESIKTLSASEKKQEALEVTSDILMKDLIKNNKLGLFYEIKLELRSHFYDMALSYMQNEDPIKALSVDKESVEGEMALLLWDGIRQELDSMSDEDKKEALDKIDSYDVEYIQKTLPSIIADLTLKSYGNKKEQFQDLKEIFDMQKEKDLYFARQDIISAMHQEQRSSIRVLAEKKNTLDNRNPSI